MTGREDETVRTQIAEMRVEQRAQRERLESSRASSQRLHAQHDARIAETRGDIGSLADEMRAEFKAVRESIAALSTQSAVANVKILFLVAIAGALGSAAVALVSHFLERLGS